MLSQAMLLLYLRNRLTLFWNLVFPAVLLLLFGLLFGSTRVGEHPYIAWVLPGMVVLNIMAFGLIRSAAVMLEWRQRGVLRRLQATPMPALVLISSYMLVNVLLCLLQSAVLILLAVLVYHVPLSGRGVVRALPMVLAAVCTFVALGQLISSRLTSVSAAVAAGQLFYYSQMFTTDLFMPLERIPGWLQQIVPYLPAYAVVRTVRPALLAEPWGTDLFASLLVMVIYGVAAACLTVLSFRWEPTR
jgi:ABC-2 type transport system permease protein